MVRRGIAATSDAREHGPDLSDCAASPNLRSRSLQEIRAEIVVRLRERRTEVESTIYARIQAGVPDSVDGQDPAYQAGMREAIAAIIEYCLEGLEHGSEWLGPIPSAAAAQARRAARNDVCLGTVLLRYFAGHRLLGEMIAEEAKGIDLLDNGLALQHLRRIQEGLLEHLTTVVADEYNHERERARRSPEQRRRELVGKLLAGDHVYPVDRAELGYELHNAWHLGLILTGGWADEPLLQLQAALDCELLSVACGDGTTWVWLGARRTLAVVEIERLLSLDDTANLSLALGSPGKGIAGWRQTHHEARGALLRALRRPERLVRYADRPLLAAALQNETLARWLKEFLAPLRARADGGTELLQALRAYIDAECNYRAAGSTLDRDRHTVENRVRTAEESLGRSLRTCLPELDVALHLEELNGWPLH